MTGHEDAQSSQSWSALLEESARRVFADHATRGVLEAAEAGVWPDALWNAVESNGLTRVLGAADAEDGGLTDAAILLRVAGAHTAPIPFAETLVASGLLSAAGLDVPDGPIALAASAPADRAGAAEPFVLEHSRGAVRAQGVARRVGWARHAHHLLVSAPIDGRPHVALFAGAGLEIRPGANVAREPRDDVALEGAALCFGRIDAGPVSDGPLAPHPGFALGALARALQMVGALEHLLAESIRFASERVQFGRPLARFQVIQHELAQLASDACAARVAAEVACRAAGRGDAGFQIAAARVRAGEAAGRGAAIAHQVHGAIGFTYEHALHFATRRLWAWRAEFGSCAYFARQLGRAAAARGADALWPDVTARP